MQQLNAKKNRKSETPRTWFRSNRVYLMGNGAWYFRTREGVEIGPYETEFEAEVEAGLLIELLKNVEPDEMKLEVIREFVLDAFVMGQSLTPIFKDDNVEAATA